MKAGTKSLVYPHCISALLVCMAIISLMTCPCPVYAQARGLGFRGLVPPRNAKPETYKGEVTGMDLPLIMIKEGLWGSAKVFVGPPGFLHEQGFSFRKGQRLTISAVPVKVEGQKILVSFRIEDRDTGQGIALRDKRGEPLWWGGGAGAGAGRQQGEKGRLDRGN
ncbi:MAG: hypothetical protein ACMUIS_00445 [bacterium]